MTEFSFIGGSQLLALKAFNDAASRTDVSFVMVGAGARLLAKEQGLYGADVEDMRATEDFDFGIQLRSWEDYGALEKALSPHFERGRNFRFTHAETEVKIDLIPFGEVEEVGKVRRPRSGDEIVVRGFREALDNCLEVDLKGLRLRVANEPGIMILKFFAFNDRNETKDLRDIWQIMNTCHVDDERIHVELADDLIEERFTYEDGPVVLLGVDMGRMVLPETVPFLKPIVLGLAEAEHPALSRIQRRESPDGRTGLTLEDVARRFGLLWKGMLKACSLDDDSGLMTTA